MAASAASLRSRALHGFVALCALGALRGADAQAGSSPQAVPCTKPNLTQTCEQLGQEALAQCREYFRYGVTECVPWVNIARDTCLASCANCSQIALGLRAQCRFSLQVMSNGALMGKFCNETKAAMENYRCPSLVDVDDGRCLTPQADICMRDCGNYGGCLCWEQKGTVLGPGCSGFTQSSTIPAFPGITFSCDMTPLECVNYQATRCGRYHHCQADMCLIRRVQCIPSEDCMMFDVCDRSNGLCYFKHRPDGSNCSDGVFYTLGDSCVRGACIGTPDYCVKYNVSCEPYSPCITGGQCHAHSGRCTYGQLPDGARCDDGRPYTLEDQCQGGSCIGKQVDPCVERGVVCTAPNTCFDAGTCDPATGRCSEAVPSWDPRPCDDGDPVTVQDRCIDGLCLGKLASGAQFLTLGQGECTDREGGRMARYAGDVADEQECMSVCEEDPQCAAYSYAFPLCSIYGTVRGRAPKSGRGWAFQEGSNNPVAISVEKAVMTAVGQRGSTCRRKGSQADSQVDYGAGSEFRIDDFFEAWKVAVFCVGIVLVFFSWPIMRSMKNCFGSRTPTGLPSIFVDPLPQDEFVEVPEDGKGETLRATADGGVPGLPDLPDLHTQQPGFTAEPPALDSPTHGNHIAALPGAPTDSSRQEGNGGF